MRHISKSARRLTAAAVIGIALGITGLSDCGGSNGSDTYAGIPAAHAATLCPAAVQPAECIQTPAGGTGLQITQGGSGTSWMVTDQHGAPMAWTNLYGLYSGGDGGKMPGGLVCVTYTVRSTVACLTPQGTLQLTPAGPDGPTGPTVTLTAADIAYLHQLEQVLLLGSSPARNRP